MVEINSTLIIEQLNRLISHEEGLGGSLEIQNSLNVIVDAIACEGVPRQHIPVFRALDLVGYWDGYGRSGWVEADKASIRELLEGEIEDIMDKLITCFDCLGFPWTEKDKKSMYRRLFYLGLMGESLSEFKLAVNCDFNLYTQTELPIWQGHMGPYFFPRRIAYRIKRWVVSGRSKLKLSVLSKVYSLFQGLKKGMPPIRPDKVDASLLKHGKCLSKDIPVHEEFSDYLDSFLKKRFSRLSEKCSNSVQECRTGRRLLSDKAVWEWSRSDRGQVGLADFLYNISDEDVEKAVSLANSSLGWQMMEMKQEYLYKRPLSLSSPDQLKMFVSSRGNTFRPVYSNGPTDSELHDVLIQYRKGLNEDIRRTVAPAVVLEPLKGRIITKPSSGSYAELTRIQGVLWSDLKTRKTFELIGRPVEDVDIWQISRGFELGMGWVSGDFDATTDNLARWVSDRILAFLLQNPSLPFVKETMAGFSSSLIDYRRDPLAREEGTWTQHYVHYKCTDQGIVQQTNGQLMGNVLSFPILCIANEASFSFVFEKLLKKKVPPHWINGDDILFKCFPDEYEVWRSFVPKVGLFPSMGKNLFQSDICQINSVLFRTKFDFTDPFRPFLRRVDRVPYLNMGIVTGRKKGKSEKASPFAVDSIEDGNYPISSFFKDVAELDSKFWSFEQSKKSYWHYHSELKSILCQQFGGLSQNSLVYERSVRNSLGVLALHLGHLSGSRSLPSKHIAFSNKFFKKSLKNPLLLMLCEWEKPVPSWTRQILV